MKALFSCIFTLLFSASAVASPQGGKSSEPTDAAYAWRGCMIDVSRHFFSVDFLKRQVDVMQRYGMNRLHLHLVDAGGWRMEIKAYPELTSKAAFRTESDWDKWWGGGDRTYLPEGTPGAYGGYYTQAELRDLVSYAAERGITVVPEIEMPGHSEEVMETYPQLKCEGNTGAQGDFCPANPETYTFLKNVLTEVMQVFPSEYIHLGGDEAGMTSWHKCTRCQIMLKELGTTDYAELQATLMRRMGQFLQQHGRRMIAWDEAITDGLPAGTAIMVWRDAAHAKKAIAKGCDVIMSPSSHCYLDYYQDAPTFEPRAIGGFLPLERVYSFNPREGLTEQEQQHVIGVQGNMWTEYIPTEEHAEHMLYPRIFALSRIGLLGQSRPAYNAFKKEALREVKRLQKDGYHPFDLKKEHGVRPEARKAVAHKAVGAKVTYNRHYSRYYPAGGDAALVNGQCGGWTHGDGTWQGFCSDTCLDVTIDLGTPTKIKSIQMDFLHCSGAWIYLPTSLTYSVSNDNKSFHTIYKSGDPRTVNEGTQFKKYLWTGKVQARYIRVQGVAPKEGEWIFTDEIIVK